MNYSNKIYNEKLFNIFELYKKCIPDECKDRIKFGNFYEIYSFINNYNKLEKKKEPIDIITNAIRSKKARKEMNERKEIKILNDIKLYGL